MINKYFYNIKTLATRINLANKATLGFYNLHVIRDLSTLFPYSGSHKDQFIEQMEAEGQLDPYLDPSIVHCY